MRGKPGVKRRIRVRMQKTRMRAWRMVPRRVWPVPLLAIIPESTHCWSGVEEGGEAEETVGELAVRMEQDGGKYWGCEPVVGFELGLLLPLPPLLALLLMGLLALEVGLEIGLNVGIGADSEFWIEEGLDMDFEEAILGLGCVTPFGGGFEVLSSIAIDCV